MNVDLCDLPTLPTTTTRPRHGCRCGVRWHGYNICHCAATACHRTFTGITAFDKHRAGSKRGEKAGECSDPLNVGLVLNDRGQWSLPPDGRDGRSFKRQAEGEE
jgi:hypothetical protein